MWLIPISDKSSSEDHWEWFMENLTEAMQKSLYAEAYRILGNPTDADDVMQESLVLGAMHCHQLKSEDRLFQWMFSIVRHQAYQHKKKSTQALLKRLQLYHNFMPNRVTLDDYVLKEDERKFLFEAMNRLKYPFKEIMQLKYSGVWNLRIIAEKLNLNYHTTRSLYQRARRELIKELEAYYEKDE